ncbi:MAG TPA: ABC transporter ATP-binding protein [Clostridiaceae bacterium]
MKRILKYVTRYKLFIIIPFIMMFVGIGLDMLNPLLQAIFIDRVLKNGESNLLILVLGGIGGITIVRAILGYIKMLMGDYLGVWVSSDLKNDLFNHIQSMPYKYFDSMNTGELMSRIGEDVDNVWMAIAFGIGFLIENAIYLVLATIILISINWKLALVSIVASPLICYLAITFEKEIGAAFGKISDQAAVINTTAQENIAGVRLVKAFAREKHEIMKFLNLNNDNYNLRIAQNKVLAKYLPALEFTSNVTVLLVVCIGGIFVIHGNFSLGTLVAFYGYSWMLVWPMRNLGWLINVISQGDASAKKIFKIMDTLPEIKDTETSVSLESIKGHVTFNNVSFKYNDEFVLKNICIDAKAGSTVAIMGTTGSGKSSIINLIGRFYELTEGSLLVDGVDVKNIKLKDLRKSMAVVSQDTFLFSESIEENILMGDKSYSKEKILEASDCACASEFIDTIADKYETLIGERGIGLSGGQKQRISIARALLKDANILVLDDATSALDMDTEYSLLKNLHQKHKKSTTFIIAHRISAVKNADQILFLQNGEIIERGTHQELLSQKGKYYEVYCDQFKDFVGLDKEVV